MVRDQKCGGFKGFNLGMMTAICIIPAVDLCRVLQVDIDLYQTGCYEENSPCQDKWEKEGMPLPK
jgi:hypothetical protein